MKKGFLDTPIGNLEIKADNGKIIEIYILPEGIKRRELREKTDEKTNTDIESNCECDPDLEQIEKAKVQLGEYFAGKRREFDLDIELNGTDFQEKVWRVLMEIPFGETLNYSQIAEKLGNPKMRRSVGNAVGKNPLLIVVPCHRVIRLGGSLGGFSAGIENKIILQKIEGIK